MKRLVEMKKCDIVIPVWNEPESTRKCVEHLGKNTGYPYRLIIIDNGSEEPTRKYLEGLNKRFPDYLFIRNNGNLGFVKSVNQGMVASANPYVCLLNNDAYVEKAWLKNLIETVESAPVNIGIANPTSNMFGKRGPDGNAPEYQELDSCKGFCMLIKKEVIEKIGLFDEVFGLGYFEEKDFSMRAGEAGYACARAKASYVFHADKLSFDKIENRKEIFERNEKIFNKKWGRPLGFAFVTKKGNLNGTKNLLYGLLKKGHRVYIFFHKEKAPAGLKDHINIKYMPLSGFLFNFLVLFKLFKRRRKKRIEIVVAEDDKAAKFFKKFVFFHKASVLKKGEI